MIDSFFLFHTGHDRRGVFSFGNSAQYTTGIAYCQHFFEYLHAEVTPYPAREIRQPAQSRRFWVGNGAVDARFSGKRRAKYTFCSAYAYNYTFMQICTPPGAISAVFRAAYGYCANFFQKSSRKALTNRAFPHTLSFGPAAGFPPGMRDCPAARIFHCLF